MFRKSGLAVVICVLLIAAAFGLSRPTSVAQYCQSHSAVATTSNLLYDPTNEAEGCVLPIAEVLMKLPPDARQLAQECKAEWIQLNEAGVLPASANVLCRVLLKDGILIDKDTLQKGNFYQVVIDEVTGPYRYVKSWFDAVRYAEQTTFGSLFFGMPIRAGVYPVIGKVEADNSWVRLKPDAYQREFASFLSAASGTFVFADQMQWDEDYGFVVERGGKYWYVSTITFQYLNLYASHSRLVKVIEGEPWLVFVSNTRLEPVKR